HFDEICAFGKAYVEAPAVACRLTPTERGMHRSCQAFGDSTGNRLAPDGYPRRKRMEKLFAGIASITGSPKPCAAASSVTASMSRTPQAALRALRKSRSKASLLGAVCRPSRLKGP